MVLLSSEPRKGGLLYLSPRAVMHCGIVSEVEGIKEHLPSPKLPTWLSNSGGGSGYHWDTIVEVDAKQHCPASQPAP